MKERPFHLWAKHASTVIESGLVCSGTTLRGIFVPQLDWHTRLSESTGELLQPRAIYD